MKRLDAARAWGTGGTFLCASETLMRLFTPQLLLRTSDFIGGAGVAREGSVLRLGDGGHLRAMPVCRSVRTA